MPENIYEGEDRWYDIEYLDSDDEAQDIPLENLLSAATFVTSILKEAGVTCGVLGGLGIVLHGIERDTVDVDIGICSSKGWRPVRQALESHLGR
jgi:predicted nucleotidyltransferase